MPARIVLCLCPFILLSLGVQPAGAEEVSSAAMEQGYAKEVSPLITTYCQKCHSAERTEAEIDLAAIATWADVRKQPETWQKVAQMLETNQMPPKDERQPKGAERKKLEDSSIYSNR